MNGSKAIKRISLLIISILIILWGLTGIYTIDSGEEALILRFGKHVKTVSDAGLNWHLPAPFEKVYKEKVTEVKRLEFGFRTTQQGDTQNKSQYEQIAHEALMFTGDENLVNVENIVQYQIADVEKYFFNVDDQVETLKIAAESVRRRVVASHKLDEVLTDGKVTIQQEIKDDLQKIVDEYEMGIVIKAVQLQDVNPPIEVDQAFKDVQSAKEDKISYINEAESYKNEKIPEARGKAAKMLNEAEAYKTKRINEAKGDVANFVQVLEKYKLGEQVTKTRMYLETLQEVLPNIDKYIVNEDGNTIKFLPLSTEAIDD